MSELYNEIDMLTASEEDLAALSDEQLLGADISEIDLSSNVPTGSYICQVEKLERKNFAADPENNRPAVARFNLTVTVLACLAAEGVEDLSKLTGRKIFFSFATNEYGIQDLARFLIYSTGIDPQDKEAMAAINGSLLALLNATVDAQMKFGVKMIENEAKNGRVYLQPSRKAKDWMSEAAAEERLDAIAEEAQMAAVG